MRIAIVGAGITGLTTAYRLSQKGHQVVIFEKEKYPGGLAAGFKKKGWDWHCEYFFHHLFTSDKTAKNLISKLGLTDRLFYLRPKTSIFYQGKNSKFDSPLSLLKFPHLSFLEKLRTGLVTAYLKTPRRWALTPPRWKNWQFEKITANTWLKKHYGEKPYQILWKPLLKSKFGPYANQISMSWFWARVKKRSSKLGYLEGGFQILIDKLVEKIEKNGGKFYFNQEITCFSDLNHDNKFDRFIFTTPTSVFLKILQNTSEVGFDFFEVKKLKKLKMIGALNLILTLKESFLKDGTYWLNVNDISFPFVAVVEHTNFVSPSYYGGNHILYVGGYYPQNHRFFKMKKEEILNEFLPFLKRINPNYQLLITNYYLSGSSSAQPIIPINYSQIIPPHQTPIKNVYLTNMQQIYPWDRGINYAIELGEKVADEVSRTWQKQK
jgi:protoporphyrinogen oxidase